jgi:hypothetical protein
MSWLMSMDGTMDTDTMKDYIQKIVSPLMEEPTMFVMDKSDKTLAELVYYAIDYSRQIHIRIAVT